MMTKWWQILPLTVGQGDGFPVSTTGDMACKRPPNKHTLRMTRDQQHAMYHLKKSEQFSCGKTSVPLEKIYIKTLRCDAWQRKRERTVTETKDSVQFIWGGEARTASLRVAGRAAPWTMLVARGHEKKMDSATFFRRPVLTSSTHNPMALFQSCSKKATQMGMLCFDMAGLRLKSGSGKWAMLFPVISFILPYVHWQVIKGT